MANFLITGLGFTKDAVRRKRVKHLEASQKGFTLIELVMVMILIGILAVTIGPRFSNSSGFTARAFADQSKAMLRYAQKLAIAQNRNVYVRLNGTDIALCFNAACSSKVPPPAAVTSPGGACTADWYCATPPANTTYAVAPNSYIAASPSFYFSALGKPYKTADTPPVTTFAAPLTLTINDTNFTTTFTVERETGYVH